MDKNQSFSFWLQQRTTLLTVSRIRPPQAHARVGGDNRSLMAQTIVKFELALLRHSCGGEGGNVPVKSTTGPERPTALLHVTRSVLGRDAANGQGALAH
jgi:hypothetical protein